MAACLVVFIDKMCVLLGGQGIFRRNLIFALVGGMGYTILVPISTGPVSWFPLDLVRVRHRQFNLFVFFTALTCIVAVLQNWPR